MHRLLITRILLAVCLCLMATVASAQTVRVTTDRAIVWREDAQVVLATVREGTLLDVLGRVGDWLLVELPEQVAGPDFPRGLIHVGQVEWVEVELRDQEVARRLEELKRPPATQPPAPADPPVSGRLFGQIGLVRLTARESFDAIFGDSQAVLPGGGFQVVAAPGVFVQLGVDRYRKEGERVFVWNGEIFRLGIPETITVVPLLLEGGYRVPLRGRVVPYAGGGIGVHFVRIRSGFALEDEDLDERFRSYSALGGVEVRTTRWLGTAFEVQYTSVPDALGEGGVSEHFNESNLGGISLRAKIVVGR